VVACDVEPAEQCFWWAAPSQSISRDEHEAYVRHDQKHFQAPVSPFLVQLSLAQKKAALHEVPFPPKFASSQSALHVLCISYGTLPRHFCAQFATRRVRSLTWHCYLISHRVLHCIFLHLSRFLVTSLIPISSRCG